MSIIADTKYGRFLQSRMCYSNGTKKEREYLKLISLIIEKHESEELVSISKDAKIDIPWE